MSAGIRLGLWAVGIAALWGAASFWLRPLGNLLPMTRDMVTATKTILAETRELQTGVAKVQVNLQALERQEQLLAEQEQLTRQVLTALRRQERLSAEATASLQQILGTERTTVALTQAADLASRTTLEGLNANASQLGRLSAATGRIQERSWATDRQLDRLLVELEGSAENFAVVERLRQAVAKAGERNSSWWERVRRWLSWQ